MVSKKDSNKARLHRHVRVRGKISGTAERPRLNVFRSSMHIYAQLIDDVAGVTLAAASSTAELKAARLAHAGDRSPIARSPVRPGPSPGSRR